VNVRQAGCVRCLDSTVGDCGAHGSTIFYSPTGPMTSAAQAVLDAAEALLDVRYGSNTVELAALFEATTAYRRARAGGGT